MLRVEQYKLQLHLPTTRPRQDVAEEVLELVVETEDDEEVAEEELKEEEEKEEEEEEEQRHPVRLDSDQSLGMQAFRAIEEALRGR